MIKKNIPNNIIKKLINTILIILEKNNQALSTYSIFIKKLFNSKLDIKLKKKSINFVYNVYLSYVFQ